MARDGVAVDARLAAAVARYAGGERFNVTAECRSLGVRTQTFYKYVGRFRAEGVDGFFPRSRRPRRSPTALSALVEDAILRARKELDDAGLDIGATSIGWWMTDHPDLWWSGPGPAPTVPSRATINRALGRRGLLARHPRRRPRRSYRRFTRASRNELWQMDGYQVTLADGRTAMVIEIIDDHSRVLLACRAVSSENDDDVWLTFCDAVSRYGLPRQVLTDNAAAFNASRRGWTSRFEAAIAELGVEAISSSIAHPQTCGKVERNHSTSRRWQRRQPIPADHAELNRQLERYRPIYNARRHQSLNGLTPDQAWAIAPVSGPYGTALPGRLHVTHTTVSASGCIDTNSVEIGIGRAYKLQPATIFRNLDDVAVFINGTLVRTLTIDRTHRYQPKTVVSAIC